MQKFDDLNISQEMKTRLQSLGFETLTDVQEQSIPLIIDGKDIVSRAKTGSGKTLAFSLPIVEMIKTQQKLPQALIIAPTRELCEQIAGVIKSIAIHKSNLKVVTLYGGTPLKGQLLSLEKGADIVIGTAGRLIDHLSRETLILSNIEILVLDEADRMLDMGFYDDIIKIISNIKKRPQTLLFSATYPDNIEKLAKSILKNPTKIEIEDEEKNDIKQIAFQARDKNNALLSILKSYKPKSVVIFCNTKIQTDELYDFLYDEGFSAISIHGDFEQRDRNEAIVQFANGSRPILVATDVASRGLDIDDIELVINYDLPFKAETYTHRIGRTARAGKDGIAISIFDSTYKLEEIAPEAIITNIAILKVDENFTISGRYETIHIDGGKRDKLRKGDILGTLCKDLGLDNNNIGKIEVLDKASYVAIDKHFVKDVFKKLQNSTIKKRKYRVWLLK
jgi:ATP-independent RNA helicase DbpA